MSILSVANLTIKRGGNTVVENVNFALHSGEVFGLIGPNGAGKSSTIGGLLGYYPIAAGSITVGDKTLEQGLELPIEVKQRIAYIPEQPMYYSDLTLREHIDWKLRLWGIAGSTIETTDLMQLVSDFQLEPHMDKFPHQCSKGTLQKLMVVSAFMMPFDLLVIDEPFIGLDVIAIRQLRKLMEQARAKGAALLVSTHVLDSAERMCQRFGFMMNGQLFAYGGLDELRRVSGESTASLEDIFVHMFEVNGGRQLPHEV